MISITLFLENGYFNLIIVFVALLTILIPFLCGYDSKVLDNGPVLETILSIQARASYSFLLASTISSVIDTLLDYKNFYNPLKWKKYIFGRVPIVINGFLVSIQFFVITDTPSIFGLTNFRAQSYLLSLSCFKIVFTGSMMIILTSIKPKLFTGKITTIVSIFVCSFIVIRTFTPGSSTTYHDFSTIINYIFLGSSVLTLLYFLHKLIITSHIMAVADYTCLLYMLIYFVGIFGSSANTFRAWSTGEHGKDFSTVEAEELCIINYCFSFVFVMLSIAPGRIARFEAVTHLVCRLICAIYVL